METQQFSNEITNAGEVLSCDLITTITCDGKAEAIITYLEMLVASPAKVMAAIRLRQYRDIIISVKRDLEKLSHSTDTSAETSLYLYVKVAQINALLRQIKEAAEDELNGGT